MGKSVKMVTEDGQKRENEYLPVNIYIYIIYLFLRAEDVHLLACRSK
jgi:hypothetical protein